MQLAKFYILTYDTKVAHSPCTMFLNANVHVHGSSPLILANPNPNPQEVPLVKFLR